MLTRLLISLSLVLAAGCTSIEKPKEKETSQKKGDDGPPPEPEKKVVSKASIASVQMIEDCPQSDPAPPPPPAADEPPPPASPPAAEPEKPAAGAMARPMRRAVPAGDIQHGDSFAPMPTICTQSTMQLNFSKDGVETDKVTIEDVRVLLPDSSDRVGTVQARKPTRWTGSKYEPWDETIPAGTEVKAAYRISVPDWGPIDKKVGGNSFGKMFIIEVDLTIGGQTQTIRSPQFPRERPHVVVT